MRGDVGAVLGVAVIAVLCISGTAVLMDGDQRQPDPIMYDVNAVAGTGVDVVDGTGTYEEGSTVRLTAHPHEHYTFDGWFLGDGTLVSSDPVYEFTLSGNTSLTARAHTDRMVSIVLRPDPGVESFTGGGEYVLDSQVTLTAKPRPGYRMLGWFGPEGLLGEGTSLTLPAADMTVDICTAEVGPVTLTLHGDAGISALNGGGPYKVGSKAVISAELNPGFSFDGWYLSERPSFFERPYSVRQDQELFMRGNLELYARTAPNYTVDILNMSALKVSGEGMYGSGTDAVLQVRDTQADAFEGWYSLDGTLLSTDSMYTPERHDAAIVARSDTCVFSGDNELLLDTFPDWYTDSSYCIVMEHYSEILIDTFRGTETYALSLSDGAYDVYYYNGLFDGSAYAEYETVRFGDSVCGTYVWTDGSGDHSMSWSADPSECFAYGSGMDRFFHPLDSMMLDFVDYKCQTVQGIAASMEEQTAGMSELDRAEYVLRFVQQTVNYQTDSDYIDMDEYWKYPSETFIERRGDCEDTSILYASIMKAMGYDVALLVLPGHMAVGLNVSGATGIPFTGNGTDYYFCETTALGWKIGEKDPRYTEATVLVV